MKYGIVQPAQRKTGIREFETIQEAEISAGLHPGEVDHGSLVCDQQDDARLIGIVVYEYGLFDPPEVQSYFGILTYNPRGYPYGRLFAGPAVLYAVDWEGETIDLKKFPPIEFYAGRDEVEAAIAANKVQRPIIAVSGNIIWQWPERRDKGPVTEGLERL